LFLISYGLSFSASTDFGNVFLHGAVKFYYLFCIPLILTLFAVMLYYRNRQIRLVICRDLKDWLNL
jgi:hypothetical protein